MKINDFVPSKFLVELGKIVPGVNTTVDVNTDSTVVQAKKFGNKVDKDGIPPTLQSNGRFDPPVAN
jgi:hypothetical protein